MLVIRKDGKALNIDAARTLEPMADDKWFVANFPGNHICYVKYSLSEYLGMIDNGMSGIVYRNWKTENEFHNIEDYHKIGKPDRRDL